METHLNLMKYFIFLLISTYLFNAKADFNTASEAYNNKSYQQAFNEFHQLAQLGNKRAQFNLGAMYLNGEYVEQDIFKAYAWGRLSEHSARPEFSQIRKNIENQLTEAGLEKAEHTFAVIKDTYGGVG